MISSGKNEIKEEKKVDKGIARLRNVPAVMFYAYIRPRQQISDKKHNLLLSPSEQSPHEEWSCPSNLLCQSSRSALLAERKIVLSAIEYYLLFYVY